MKFRSFVLGVGIFIVYLLALFQGIQTFYPSPQYNDFCDLSIGKSFPLEGCSFSTELRNKETSCYSLGGNFVYEYGDNGCPVDGYCDECGISYDRALDNYANRLFLISIVLGIIVLVVGLFLLKKEPVGSSLLASAIFTVFFGVVRNWRNFTESWRFFLLFVLLVALVWLTLRLEAGSKKKGKSLFSKLKFWK